MLKLCLCLLLLFTDCYDPFPVKTYKPSRPNFPFPDLPAEFPEGTIVHPIAFPKKKLVVVGRSGWVNKDVYCRSENGNIITYPYWEIELDVVPMLEK